MQWYAIAFLWISRVTCETVIFAGSILFIYFLLSVYLFVELLRAALKTNSLKNAIICLYNLLSFCH